MADNALMPSYRQQELRAQPRTLRNQLFDWLGLSPTVENWAQARGFGRNALMGQDIVPRGTFEPGPAGTNALISDIVESGPFMALTTKPVQAAAKAASKMLDVVDFENMARRLPQGPRAVNDAFDVIGVPSVGYHEYFIVPKAATSPWDEAGQSIARGRFAVRPGQEGGVEVTNALLDEGLRRQGIGSRVYDYVASDFAPVPLRPSPEAQQSPAARAFWAKRQGQPPAPAGIRAYHGSPHSFDRFDMSKIGTGEGAQAYGHGLYFAEKEGTAKSYRDALGAAPPAWGLSKGGKYFPAEGTSYYGVQRLNEKLAERLPYGSQDVLTGDDITRALREIQADAAKIKGANGDRLRSEVASVERMLVDNPDLQFMRNPPTGHMYEVNIRANPEDFLDWDKPLSQQSPQVQQRLSKWGENVTGYDPLGRDILQQKLPFELRYEHGIKGSPEHVASVALQQSGIPGIRYLDQGSRGATPMPLLDGKAIKGNAALDTAATVLRREGSAEAAVKALEGAKDADMQEAARLLRAGRVSLGDPQGTSNYVVFDDRIIDIVRKYGWAAVAPLLGLNALTTPDPTLRPES